MDPTKAVMTGQAQSHSASSPTLAGHAQRRLLATGQVLFWTGGSLWIGRGEGRSQWHQHHALQITLALEGECRFRTSKDGAWTTFTGAIVMTNRHHEFEVDGATIAQTFVEPETTAGRWLVRRYSAAVISALPEPERSSMASILLNAFRNKASAEELISSAQLALAVLVSATSVVTPVDARIIRATDYIRSHLRAPFTLADAANAAALSPSRFRHLFVAETGTTYRAYVLWLRLNAAIEVSMAGRSWTAAAHESGFADSAHLTRTFKRMFGMSPASLVHE
jgi:AraC family transcriptional regulator